MSARSGFGSAKRAALSRRDVVIDFATAVRQRAWVLRMSYARGGGDQAIAPEPMGFTGKEGDEEVGLTYFGERYLIARIGRWASPDPLQIHAAGGGEVGNSYHYVSGNILASRDAVGLDGTDLLSEQNRAPHGAFAWTDSGASWLAATGRTQVERLANAIRNGPGAASDTTRSVDAALDSTGKGGTGEVG